MKLFSTFLSLRAFSVAAALVLAPPVEASRPQWPLATVHSAQGRISNVRVSEKSGTLYVTGTMTRSFGYGLSAGGHVHVELLGPCGRVIAQKKTLTHPFHSRRERNRLGRHSFVISFPLSAHERIESVRVSYHPASHS